MNNNSKQLYLDFDEYIRQGEPSKKEKASIWQTAIGLQAVDGLQTSEYLKTTACRHIEGEIDIDEARKLIKSYYQSKTLREAGENDMQEADKHFRLIPASVPRNSPPSHDPVPPSAAQCG